MFSCAHMEAGGLIGQEFTIYFCMEAVSNYQSKFSWNFIYKGIWMEIPYSISIQIPLYMYVWILGSFFTSRFLSVF